jgi:glycerophosphoryl diester phosphodiesterase
MVAVTKSKGIAIWLDVQSKDDGPGSWMNALGKNIQGLQTDHPDALIDYLKKNRLR